MESLVNNLPKDNLVHTTAHFEHPDLISRKGVYPYEYMDGPDRFLETSLPSIDKFYSSLSDSGISDEDYAHARNVWDTYGLTSLRDCHDLYLKSDVTLLCDVFESFRSMALETYKLNPCYFYTSPGLSWEACLKRVSTISNRYAKAYLFDGQGGQGG